MNIISNCTTSTLADAAKRLLQGNLVAFPTETVYGLGADATNKAAITKLYAAKGRPANHPLIVHISSSVQLNKWATDIPKYAIELTRTFWPGPMTLILPRTELAEDYITGGQKNVGLRVPGNFNTLKLLKIFEAQGGLGVAAPSANRFGKVSPTTAGAVFDELSDYLSIDDLILDGGPCAVGVESTIIDCTKSKPKILRPGAITGEMIKVTTGISIDPIKMILRSHRVVVPGMLQSHYSPKADVILDQFPEPGSGFIALSSFKTPKGVIRLASPVNNIEYARVLYQALRSADLQQINKVFVYIPPGDDIAVAIKDRLLKASK